MSDEARMQASEKWLQKYRATNRAVAIASPQPDTPPPQIEPPSRDELGLAAQELYRDINACQYPDQLHAMAKPVWERNYASLLNDGEASYLASFIERRKPVSQRTKAGKFALAPLNSRLSRFAPRQRPRCPNR